MSETFKAQPDKLHALQIAAPDIADWLLDRDPVAVGSFDEIGREEYQRAFTVARTAGADVIDDIYGGLLEVFANQGTEADFQKAVIPILRRKGWLGGDQQQIATRVRLIYDTNLRLARAAGRWNNYQANRLSFPYLRAFTVGDERVRHPPKSPESDHRAWDGIILPVEHPFWAEYWPPLGFRCRCAVVQMTRSQLARYRGGVTDPADLADRISRLGPPVFASPNAGIAKQLSAIVSASNDKPNPMPGRHPVDPVQTAKEGGDVWDAVMRSKSLDDIGRQLAAMGIG